MKQKLLGCVNNLLSAVQGAFLPMGSATERPAFGASCERVDDGRRRGSDPVRATRKPLHKASGCFKGRETF